MQPQRPLLRHKAQMRLPRACSFSKTVHPLRGTRQRSYSLLRREPLAKLLSAATFPQTESTSREQAFSLQLAMYGAFFVMRRRAARLAREELLFSIPELPVSSVRISRKWWQTRFTGHVSQLI